MFEELNKDQLEAKLKEIQPLHDKLALYQKQINDALRPIQADITTIKKMLEYIDKPVCNLDYYEIRAGRCKNADVYHGNVYCSNPYCKQ